MTAPESSACSLAELAAGLDESIGATLCGSGDLIVRGVQTLDAAGPDELTFVTDEHYAAHWPASKAGAAVAPAALDGLPDDGY